MDSTKLRAWWWHRQALDGSMAGASAAEVLAATGWSRSVAGASPYLGLFARAGLDRSAVDAAVAALRIQELPAARGCTYVVPASDFALALAAGREAGSDADLRLARKLGATDAEVDRLCDTVLRAAGKAPRTPEELREAAGTAVRNFGVEGRKKGLASTLSIALARLQAEGKLRRVPVDGRLDRQRYRYVAWRRGPFEREAPSPETWAIELARRFFSWTGPTTVAAFAEFSGLGLRAARTAADALGLVPVERGDARLMPAADREALDAYAPPKKPAYSLVGSLDGLFHLRRDLASHLAPEDLDRPVGGLSDLPSHAIVDRGRLVGLWEFDPASGKVVWSAFVPADAALRAAVARTERFVRDSLGDARSYSLDSPESRAPRIAALRRGAETGRAVRPGRDRRAAARSRRRP